MIEYILSATIFASSLAMLISLYRFNNPPKIKVDEIVSTLPEGVSYRSMVEELEIRREALRKAILEVYKKFEDGLISEETKDILISRFEGELDNVEERLKSLRLYAELESLKEEYERLNREYERKRAELERRIHELESKIGKVEPGKKPAEKAEKTEEKPKRKSREETEDTLDEILKEVSKIIEEYGVE